MAQSVEYPDLKFVEPRAWNSGRAVGQPSVIVIHCTAGSEGPTSAEDGAAYDARRTDGTSTHYFHDQDSTIQCVLTKDRANHAKGTGNRIGIGHELCGGAFQTPTQWADAASAGTLLRAAVQCARDAKKWGIPIRRLTIAQLRNGERGFAGHNDISDAFGESNHTDPGPHFPWDSFLSMVKHETDISPMNAVDRSEVRAIFREELTAERDNYAAETVGREFARQGGPTGNTSIRQAVAWSDANLQNLAGKLSEVDAEVAFLRAQCESIGSTLSVVTSKLDALLARVPAPPAPPK